MHEYLVLLPNGGWSSLTLVNDQKSDAQVVHSNGAIETLPYADALEVLAYVASKPNIYTVSIVE